MAVEIDKVKKRQGRKKKVLSMQEIEKINFLYHTNERNITDIAKIMGYSPPVVERHIFYSKDKWREWESANLES